MIPPTRTNSLSTVVRSTSTIQNIAQSPPFSSKINVSELLFWSLVPQKWCSWIDFWKSSRNSRVYLCKNSTVLEPAKVQCLGVSAEVDLSSGILPNWPTNKNSTYIPDCVPSLIVPYFSFFKTFNSLFLIFFSFDWNSSICIIYNKWVKFKLLWIVAAPTYLPQAKKPNKF